MTDPNSGVNKQRHQSTPSPCSDNEMCLKRTPDSNAAATLNDTNAKKSSRKSASTSSSDEAKQNSTSSRKRSLENPPLESASTNSTETTTPLRQSPLRSSHRTTSMFNLRSAPPFSRSRSVTHTPRETKVSMIRKQLAHSSSTRSSDDGQTSGPAGEYLTPFQRKEQVIKELRQALKESHDKLRQKDREIQEIVSEKDVALSALLTDKDDEIHALRDRVTELEQECARLNEVQDKMKDEIDMLKLRNKELELDAKEREETQREMYLLMYQKGKRCADFERQDTLEELASQDPNAVPVPELLAKLEHLQEKLAELQSTTRINQYQDGVLTSPKTDHEVTIRCLKDALFHYLTSEGHVAKTQNLNILLGLASFTDVQRRKIETALAKSKTQKKNS